MSLPEVILWRELRRRQFAGFRFRRQHPIGPYVLDFYCPSAALTVEVDGLAHDTAARVRHDECREMWLSRQGVKVLRVRASDVLRDDSREAVLRAIEAAAAAPSTVLRTVPLPHGVGEDQPRQQRWSMHG